MEDTDLQNQIAATPENREPASPTERRAHARHLFSALAEVIEPRTRTRLTCRATDLSFGGIYVDTISPFQVGTQVLVRLTSEGHIFNIGARVTYALNGMGMGLAFAPDMSAGQADVLRSWIAELSGDLLAAATIDFDAVTAVLKPTERSSAVDETQKLRDVTQGLVEMLLHKQILTESEASALRSKLAR
jgi:hypothetical protein